ncbi:ammonium transporter [Rhizoclosmatium globosum]|uniref:Ammonium transporter n=1 Tax=Rhizoclosmatium globosum TaxID=329046 RepID=A0A1Y2CLF9_9FUNG|nr:ammonium transporter [Rhizoclosmatium globosum]|eukprot:ORY47840.1 ammonium transporter [Rhizoclosmatium globosum]
MSSGSSVTNHSEGLEAAMIFIMIPGLGLFYAGLAEQKNAMTMLHTCLLMFAVIVLQWTLFGYTIAFSDTSSSSVIGDLKYAMLLDTMHSANKLAPTIPNSLWALYQLMAAAITPGLWIGAVAGRMRILPTLVFGVLWSTFVYDVAAYSVFGVNGWLHKMDVLDYAGGTVVHLTAGCTAVVLALVVGKRIDYGKREYSNSSPAYVYIGTALLWFGWMGFDGGCSTAANERAINAAFTTHIAGATGGLVWMAMDALVNKKRLSSIGFCTGAVAGLATMTAGSGHVQPGVGLVFGFLAGVLCFYGVKVMHFLKIDDSLDVMAVHGVGGTLGMILTGIFAQYTVTATGVTESITAGWVDNVWKQVPVQLLAVVAWIPGLHLRCSEEDEVLGLDNSEVGETAYPYVMVESVDKKEFEAAYSQATIV